MKCLYVRERHCGAAAAAAALSLFGIRRWKEKKDKTVYQSMTAACLHSCVNNEKFHVHTILFFLFRSFLLAAI